MIIETSMGIYPGKPLKGKQKYAKLYHYTSLETFEKIWESKLLKFGPISDLNDLNECYKKVSFPFNFSPTYTIDDVKSYSDSFLNEIMSYKQISLTMDYDSYIKGCMSPMMWGHYGDKSKGVCIELDYDKIIYSKGMYHKPIKYVKLIQDSTYIPHNVTKTCSIEDFIRKQLNTIYFTKTKDWSGENEFRIISNKYDSLDISNAISAVHVTDRNSSTCESVEKRTAGVVPIKYLNHISCNGKRMIELRNINDCGDFLISPKKPEH